ncbi:MAG: transcription antitermination protein NusB [Flavobacteriaceae bacterium]|nr:transcription antitermination protein NusB [Flavobacteriaceae bacterium]
MLNRRFVRIKTMQALYAFWQQEGGSIQAQRTFYDQSIEKLGLAYLTILDLLLAIRQLAIQTDEHHRQKNYFNQDMVKPLIPFTENKVLEVLATHADLATQCSNLSVNWQKDYDKLKPLMESLAESNFFKRYMEGPAEDFQGQKDFILTTYKWLMNESELLDSLMEDRFLSWDDDQPVVFANVLKTVDSIKEDGTVVLCNEPDAEFLEIKKFGKDLLDKTISHSEDYEKLITDKTPNWDPERIANTDYVLMKMALSEFLNFESIPVKVTINEYMELSKMYSTPKSYQFLNGVLDALQKDLKAEGRMVKKGRGLVG